MNHGDDPGRWSQGAAPSADEQKAAELFRAARPVAPLSPEALARIEYGITAKMAAGIGAAVWTKLVIGALVVGGGSVAALLVFGGEQERSAPAQLATAPAPIAPPVIAAQPAAPQLAPPAPEPVAAPRPALTPPRRVERPSIAPPNTLAQEAALLERAVKAVRQNPAGALVALDEHQVRFPNGQLAAEARRLRLDALIAMSRHEEAAAHARELGKRTPARALELVVVEGEQLMAAGRHRAALSRFERALADGATGVLAERAFFGRVSTRRALGDALGARTDAQAYLQRFPNGRHAAEVRAWISAQP